MDKRGRVRAVYYQAMLRKMIVRPLTFVALLTALCFGVSVPVRADQAADQNVLYDGNTHLVFTPYLWVPSIGGTARFNTFDETGRFPIEGNGSQMFDIGINPSQYVPRLNSGFMASGQIRQGKWAVIGDFIYFNLSGENSQIGNLTGPGGIVTLTGSASAQTRVNGTLITAAPSYTVLRDGATAVNVLVGGRFAFTNVAATWQLMGPLGFLNRSGAVKGSESLQDIIVGSYGQFGLGKGNWSVPYYLDLGTGTPSFTWQALLGVKYGDLSLVYRHLAFNAQSGNDLIQTLHLSGPELGYSFRF